MKFARNLFSCYSDCTNEKPKENMYLSAYLELHSISQKDFCEKIGIHQSTLNNYLKGRRIPTAQICIRIEKATKGKVTIDELIDFPYTLKKTL